MSRVVLYIAFSETNLNKKIPCPKEQGKTKVIGKCVFCNRLQN